MEREVSKELRKEAMARTKHNSENAGTILGSESIWVLLAIKIKLLSDTGHVRKVCGNTG